MKNKTIQKKQAKKVIDILLFVFLLLSLHQSNGVNWTSFHCIIGLGLFALMIVHIWQHWKLTKSFLKKKLMLKNKMTFATIICFIIMAITIICFIIGVDAGTFHHRVAHLFYAVVVLHTIQKFKLFLSLFNRH